MRRILATLAVVGALLFSAGSAWADWDDGVAAYERGDYVTALREWRPLAEQGNAEAQTDLAMLYFYGEGVAVNYFKSMKWNHKAAMQGDAGGQTSVGTHYSRGLGVPVNHTEAMKWWRKAAGQGHEGAKVRVNRLEAK